ncbi:hypothetical protein A8M77_04405 [Variovorax sp. JS1663]|nr:hypothetical protein A8M77_04405 [Variovorax sp. JS1663]
MLHCSMETLTEHLRTGLEDLAADVAHARRQEELGRLALLCFCEIRPWARRAEEECLAAKASAMSAQSVPTSRNAFLKRIDALIAELEQTCERAGLGESAANLRRARAVEPQPWGRSPT